MPKHSRLFVKPFIGGINTETSSVEDAILHTADELNCTILPEGIRGRRLGFNIERDGKWINNNDKIVAQAIYHWRNVTDDKNFIVLQINTFLYILEDIQPHSLQKPLYSIDLSEKYMSSNDSVLPLSMTSVKNTLFISSKWVYPLVLRYDLKSKDFKIEINNLKFRDIVGIDDGFEVDEMPYNTNMNQEHLYNLYNQGWDMSIYNPEDKTTTHLIPINDPESGLFYQNIGRYPSNTMQWSSAKTLSFTEDDYGLHKILNTYLGNTPAPKGHFILDYLNRNRSYTSGIYITNISGEDTPIGTGVFTGGHNLLFRSNDSDAEQWFYYPGLEGYGFGKDYVPDAYYRIQLPSEFTGQIRSLLVSIKDIMDVTACGVNFEPMSYKDLSNYIFKDDIVLDIIGIDAEGNKTTISSQTLERFPNVTVTDVWTQYKLDFENDTSYSRYELFLRFPNATWPSFIPYSWEISVSMSNPDVGDVSDITAGLSSSDILEGAVTDVASFGGRIFYLCGNTVLFSQTLAGDVSNYDKCYQENDPTSEEISDVLPTDGGLIFLTSIGTGKSLKSFYRGVIVFGEQEVTGVLSNAINLFSATDYDIVKITNAGICGKFSAVETDLNIFYWSQHGIYMIGLEDNNIYSKCISSETIQRFYNNLPDVAKENVIGYYDYASNRIFWFYPTTNEIKKLNGCLVYDLINNSFMVYSIDIGNVIRDEQDCFIRYVEETDTINDGIVYDKNNNVVGRVENKYIVDCTPSSTVTYINPTQVVKAGGKFLKAGGSPVIAFKNTTDKNREKTAGIILVSDGVNYSFGAFNDTSFKDWGTSPYESYMISKPIMFEGFSTFGNPINSTATDKQVPVLQTLFKRTEQSPLRNGKDYIGASGAYIRMRWGWSLDDRSNRWDMVQNGYRPQKDFLHDEYVESKIHVRGRGKAFQIEIRNDDNKDFRLAGMNLLVRSR